MKCSLNYLGWRVGFIEIRGLFCKKHSTEMVHVYSNRGIKNRWCRLDRNHYEPVRTVYPSNHKSAAHILLGLINSYPPDQDPTALIASIPNGVIV